MVTSGITSCLVSLPAAHENGRSTRAIARITHSIVKQHFSVPKCSWGTGEFSRSDLGVKGETAPRTDPRPACRRLLLVPVVPRPRPLFPLLVELVVEV